MLKPAISRFAVTTPSAATTTTGSESGKRMAADPGRRSGLDGNLIAIAIAALLLFGWAQRDEEYLTPDSGLGYWLGIVGSAMMVALLYYSYRKRQRHGRGFLSIPTWFRIHMLLGVLGPLLVIFHTNFHVGDVNSSVALISMLIVASSGIAGRYLYKRIFDGLSEHKLAAQEIAADIATLRGEFGAHGQLAEPLFDELDAFGRTIMERPGDNVLTSLVRGARGVVRAAWMRHRLPGRIRRLVDARGAVEGWARGERRRRSKEMRSVVGTYFDSTLRMAQMRVFERLFSLWHTVHVPLYIFMVLTALIHIWAVHRY